MEHSTAARYLLWIYILMCTASGFEGARILGIFPTPSISHQLPFQTIMKALAARGHQITVISTDPIKKPLPNYTDIDISFSYKYFRSSFDFAKMDQTTTIDLVSQAIHVFTKLTEDQLSSPQLQEFIKRYEKAKRKLEDLYPKEEDPDDTQYGAGMHGDDFNPRL